MPEREGVIRFSADAPFIYFIEDHPRYGPVVAPLFEAIAAGTFLIG